jgi:predicted GNAT family acetyltransferase
LGTSAESLLEALRSACTIEEWEHSALSKGSDVRYGYFEGEQLTAAGISDIWSEHVVGPGVLSHPAARGRGHGTAVASAIVTQALQAGNLVMYQTLLDNAPAVAVAQRLGFQHYATHLAVRL